jgi:hypothetical protein
MPGPSSFEARDLQSLTPQGDVELSQLKRERFVYQQPALFADANINPAT